VEIERRDLLRGAAVATAVGFRGRAQEARGNLASIKALVFDVFGTVVDWRGSIIQEGAAWGKARNLKIDWARFADRWREGYGPAMDKVRKGALPWTKIDDLHRMILEELLKEFRIDDLTEEEKSHWNRVWHRLKPWPDSVAGLTRLKKKCIIAPLSNGNIALLTNMAKHSGLPWDAILGAELVKRYKPDPEVYRSASEFLGVRPHEVMMVAAHLGDLKAARSSGLRTAFIYRPLEFGPGREANNANPGDFDVVSSDALDLAKQMGA
jgi:2-haloacid dehalogenase